VATSVRAILERQAALKEKVAAVKRLPKGKVDAAQLDLLEKEFAELQELVEKAVAAKKTGA
jgi:hypothetical protein